MLGHTNGDGKMPETQKRVYCAGPLFTNKEREEMIDLASALEEADYLTFLPQRDGLELTKCIENLVAEGVSEQEAGELMSRAIFALDIYMVLEECDALIANLNGRVPDEGTVAEAAMAWSRGKPVVGYKADSRTAFGGQDNPLVAGLFEFDLCQTAEDVVGSLREVLSTRSSSNGFLSRREKEIDGHRRLGSKIWNLLEQRCCLDDVVAIILKSQEVLVRS